MTEKNDFSSKSLQVIPVEYKKEKPLAETITPFTELPFYNKIREIRLRGYRKVIREETGLFDDLIYHSMTLNRLKGLKTEIETERLKRQNELREQQRKAALADKEDRIAHLEADLRIAELEKKQVEIGQAQVEPSKLDELRKALKEELLIKQMNDDHSLEKLKLKIRKDIKKEAIIDQMFEEIYSERFQGKTTEDYTEEDWEWHKRLERYFETIMARD